MDRFLKPDKLDTDPGAENAENQWTYWKVTFDNFVATFTGDAALSNEAKKAALINCVSPYLLLNQNWGRALGKSLDHFTLRGRACGRKVACCAGHCQFDWGVMTP